MFIKQTKNVFEAISYLQYEKNIFVNRCHIEYRYNFTKNHDPSAYKEKTNKEDKIYIENSPNPSINDQVVENSSKEKINIKSLLIKMIETNDAENAKKTIEDIFILIQDSPGTSEVNLHVTSKDKIVKILLPKKVDINKILTERLIEVVGENNVSTIR